MEVLIEGGLHLFVEILRANNKGNSSSAPSSTAKKGPPVDQAKILALRKTHEATALAIEKQKEKLKSALLLHAPTSSQVKAEQKKLDALVQEFERQTQELDLADEKKQLEEVWWVRPAAVASSVVLLPFLSIAFGKDFGNAGLFHLIEIRKKEKECKNLLQHEQLYGGNTNPHWVLTNEVLLNSEKASESMLTHRYVSLANRSIALFGALGVLIGAWNNYGIGIGLAGLTVSVCGIIGEWVRYSSIKKEVARNLDRASKGAKQLLEITEPYIPRSPDNFVPNSAAFSNPTAPLL